MGAVIVLGSINRDVFFRVPSLPAPRETGPGADTCTGLGGKGANATLDLNLLIDGLETRLRSVDVLRRVDVLVLNAGEATEPAATTGTGPPPATLDLGRMGNAACAVRGPGTTPIFPDATAVEV
nr:hypothetical protein GCM10010200_006090 [Actinomadura rugatobispora]